MNILRFLIKNNRKNQRHVINCSNMYFNALIPPCITSKIDFRVYIYFKDVDSNMIIQILLVNLIKKYNFNINSIESYNSFIMWNDSISQSSFESTNAFLKEFTELLENNIEITIYYSYEWSQPPLLFEI